MFNTAALHDVHNKIEEKIDESRSTLHELEMQREPIMDELQSRKDDHDFGSMAQDFLVDPFLRAQGGPPSPPPKQQDVFTDISDDNGEDSSSEDGRNSSKGKGKADVHIANSIFFQLNWGWLGHLMAHMIFTSSAAAERIWIVLRDVGIFSCKYHVFHDFMCRLTTVGDVRLIEALLEDETWTALTQFWIAEAQHTGVLSFSSKKSDEIKSALRNRAKIFSVTPLPEESLDFFAREIDHFL